jgi:riboflavin synthase
MTLSPGDSVCISGVCLTVVEASSERMSFDVIGETLNCTTLGSLSPGDPVNVEPSLTASTPISGHFVQGHVEGAATVTAVEQGGDDVRITLQPPADLLACIVPKGSVTVDGVSMTVAAVGQDDFQIALIPTTLQITTLGKAQRGARVNIETDVISRTVVHTLQQMQSVGANGNEQVNVDTLRRAGFVQ